MNNRHAELESWLRSRGVERPRRIEHLGGGDTCRTELWHLDDQSSVVVKHHSESLPGLFAGEAAGLRAFAATDTLRSPAVYYQDERCLVLEYIAPGSLTHSGWEAFGRGLAAMHRQTVPSFGFECDTYCGGTRQPNPQTDDGYAFFAEQRLGYQARLAAERGLLRRTDRDRITRLAERLPEWVPKQPPSLVHGDLWSGNVHADRQGRASLIDPAAYWGWAEADLAMTTLFGTLPEAFYRAYEEVNPLADGWRERLSLYNLYHLLNHLNLFGSGYYTSTMAVVNRWVD